MEAGRLQKQEGLNSDVLARSLFILLLSFIAFRSAAQDTSLVYGRLINQDGVPIEAAHIHLQGTDHVTTSDENGRYNIWVPSNQPATIIFSHLSFGMYTEQVTVPRGEKRRLDKTLQASATLLNPVDIEKVKKRQGHMLSSIDPKPAATLPGPNPGIEGLLKVVGIGVSSNNELSSQYSVRGGNFDENLVYVNDIEIYRPFLVRSGQQEGLSFVNPDMVSSVGFSAGGFEARYGDKMSSVLDIRYKDPLKFGGSVSGSLLGGSVHLENASDNHRFTYVAGLRYKTNQYVLKSLDTDGEYKPYFTDFQSLLTYDITPEIELEALTNWSRNHYTMVPQSRTTEFGTVKQALQLRVFFEGQEVDEFDTYFGALALNVKPNSKTKLRFISSAFQTYESETFDILGQYYLGELETDYGKDNFGDVAFNRGVGSFLNHARNYLDATVITAEHKGEYKDGNAKYYWGFKVGKELIHDQLSEWTLIDSAGYSLPHGTGSTLDLFDVSKARLGLSSHRYSGYAQGTWTLNDSIDMELSAGVRTQYWDVNEQWLFSPRASLSFQPNWKRETVIRFASGVYHQPPFYRELRNTEGQLNKNIKAQTSIHFIAGADQYFHAWNRPFKWVTEVYFKYLRNLIPYQVDNLRIRYAAENTSTGYATGIDFKINGEFVPGIDSWFNLSLLQTREDISNDSYMDTSGVTHPIGSVPRPADQRVNVGIYFQDYLPKNPTYKVHLNLLFGTGLPIWPPHAQRTPDAIKRMPPYRRVDIGFSKQLIGENSKPVTQGFFSHFNSMWLSLEVFNLLQVNNTNSYLWIKDVDNLEWAVPNYLTSRQLNLRLTGRF